VALSRCTSLEGLVLIKPLLKRHIWTDFNVVEFLSKYQHKKSEKSDPADLKRALLEKSNQEQNRPEITYLKPNDEKSVRVIRPETMGRWDSRAKHIWGLCFLHHCETNSGLSASTGYWK